MPCGSSVRGRDPSFAEAASEDETAGSAGEQAMTRKKARQAPPARRTRKPQAARPDDRATASPRGARPVRSADPGRPVTIVGIGASAGGLDAFTTVLRTLPARPGFAIVFVQHLAPQHESALVTLLSGQTALPVVQVNEGMQVKPNQVYVIPPNAQMVISGRALHITPRPGDRTQYTPVDAFFLSLARAAGRRAIGVILSGTASDGAIGIREIKAAGGTTIVQTPESAKYDGMPRAALASGMVDLALTPEQIGPALTQLARETHVPKVAPAPETEITDEQLSDVFDLLRAAHAVDFRHYKHPTIKRRLFRRMALHRVNDVGEYLKLLQTDGNELRNLYRDLLIQVTRFFREPESFDAITREVLPAILEHRTGDRPIRAWVSGCSTGEEAYSLAIILLEFLAKQQSNARVQIFATDVSETAIEQARAGVYPPAIENDVGADRLRRFFTKSDGGYRVSKMIRDLVVFARQDLVRDPPFSRLDLILCRNVLIYMDLPLQKKLLSVFHGALNTDGFLVLGQAETVGGQATLFSVVDKKFRVHRKRATAVAPTMLHSVENPATAPTNKKPRTDAPAAEKALQAEVNRIINDRFAPPGVVVDSDLQIVQFRGQTGSFLEPAPGEASLSLLKMTREGLLYGLRSAIQRARKSRGPVRRSGLQVRSGKHWIHVDVEVIPLTATARAHFLVLFHEREGKGQSRKAAAESITPQGREKVRPQINLLQRELAASREYMQSIIQELEAANEELQSANEEILSSNEELQSTNEELDTAKEELQSTNEELNTVNEELHGRNEELASLNSDLVNLLASVQIAIVIVGADLRIRRFTPMAEKVLNLIPADIDRSIAHINPNLEGAHLEELIAECIDGIIPVEREVRDRQGRWYALRVRPYRTPENRIDGAVLALFDVDTPKRHEAYARSAMDLADALVQAAPEAMAVLDSGLHIRSANPGFVTLCQLPPDGFHDRLLTELGTSSVGFEQLAIKAGASESRPLMTVQLQPAPAAQPVELVARIFPGPGAAGQLILLTAKNPDAVTAGR
jgi:two-component system CheB/CheR fusion protein